MARRYLLNPLPAAGGTAALGQDVAHHLAHVMRAKVGDPVRLFDGAGSEAAATVVEVARARVAVRIDAVEPATREPEVHVTLAIALPKGPRADAVFEHGCEVGIRHFIPLQTERSTLGSERRADAATKRAARWAKILEAAAGQCDRAFVPTVETTLHSLEALSARPDLPEERYLAAIDGERLGTARSGRVVLAVGPEGGFSPAEDELLRARGFAPASLGPLTLRAETAGIVGAFRLLG